jgi:hypothetical protein
MIGDVAEELNESGNPCGPLLGRYARAALHVRPTGGELVPPLEIGNKACGAIELSDVFIPLMLFEIRLNGDLTKSHIGEYTACIDVIVRDIIGDAALFRIREYAMMAPVPITPGSPVRVQRPAALPII